MTFGSPWLLCLLPLVPLVWLFLAFVRRPPTLVLPSVRPFRRRGGSARRFRAPSAAENLLLAASALLVVALARPRSGTERVVVHTKGLDMILALDMSGSMTAYDPPPEMQSSRQIGNAIRSGTLGNRFDTAKRELARFAADRPGDRIGLVGFADFAYRLVPPTTDRELLNERLKRLKPGQLGTGTNLASAIAAAVNRLKSADSPRRVVVLFTDGADTVPFRVTPEQAALLAKERNVVIHTVGIGGNRSVMAENTAFGVQLRRVSGDFDAAMLRRIAAATGGEYFHAGNAAGLRRVCEEIDKLERTDRNVEKFVEYREYAPVLALAAAALILAGAVLGCTWKLRLP